MECLPPGIRRILPLLRSSTAAAIHHHSKNESAGVSDSSLPLLGFKHGVGADGKGGGGPMAGYDRWCKKGEFSLCSLFLPCTVFPSPLLYFPRRHFKALNFESAGHGRSKALMVRGQGVSAETWMGAKRKWASSWRLFPVESSEWAVYKSRTLNYTERPFNIWILDPLGLSIGLERKSLQVKGSACLFSMEKHRW